MNEIRRRSRLLANRPNPVSVDSSRTAGVVPEVRRTGRFRSVVLCSQPSVDPCPCSRRQRPRSSRGFTPSPADPSASTNTRRGRRCRSIPASARCPIPLSEASAALGAPVVLPDTRRIGPSDVGCGHQGVPTARWGKTCTITITVLPDLGHRRARSAPPAHTARPALEARTRLRRSDPLFARRVFEAGSAPGVPGRGWPLDRSSI